MAASDLPADGHPPALAGSAASQSPLPRGDVAAPDPSAPPAGGSGQVSPPLASTLPAGGGGQAPAAGENAAVTQGKVEPPRPAVGNQSPAGAREAQRDAWKAAIGAKNARQARDRAKAKPQAPRAGMVRYRPRGGRG